MTFHPHGKNLIGGKWVAGMSTFSSSPASGPAYQFAVGTIEQVDQAANVAELAFWSYSATAASVRANFLREIANQIEIRAESITAIGSAESGLPPARLEGERARTIGQLRLFAEHIENGDYLDKRHDPAQPDRKPLPRPDLKMMQRPVGPIAVFGASNFPLAFSTAGGDTASALAAGCPVIVKGHSAHPGTSEIVAEAMHAAIAVCNLHPGVFSLIQGGSRDVGHALVCHPLIRAVGFTGSLWGGRALFDLCVSRPDPIPFFGELGSVNPMFVLPHAAQTRTGEIARGWAQSLTMGVGQFCTKPGLAIVPLASAEAFSVAASQVLGCTGVQTMLTQGIAEAYRTGRQRLADHEGVTCEMMEPSNDRQAEPSLFRTDAQTWMSCEALGEEVFGPIGLIVTVEHSQEAVELAHHLKGQLTCTLHLDADDGDLTRKLMPVLERKAGRILFNGYPTGVEVCDSMIHGGPYPASTNFGATSVGTMAIRRWLRPVCFQNVPEELMPCT